MSSTNGVSGGGSGSNKASFDDLFKTIQNLEEKVQTDAARHNFNVKNELSGQNTRYYSKSYLIESASSSLVCRVGCEDDVTDSAVF